MFCWEGSDTKIRKFKAPHLARIDLVEHHLRFNFDFFASKSTSRTKLTAESQLPRVTEMKAAGKQTYRGNIITDASGDWCTLR